MMREAFPVVLTADLLEAFAGTFLSPRYDGAKPTPPFHRECWALYCSSISQAAAIAPRDHAKSTALTFDYMLGECLFRLSDYCILVGSTEDKAGEQLSNISEELHDNKDLREQFGVSKFEVDTRTEIICRMDDGHRFRILARGAEQRIRGALWNGKRPNLIVCDDMEDDEQVENKDRRTKFRRWFFRALLQALSKSGKIRVHGTILHEDSLLNRIRRMKSWQHLFYKAHAGFDDFADMLWPERWTQGALKARRQTFIDDGDAGGYSQEFLNDPEDNSDAFLRKDDFIPMQEGDVGVWKQIACAWDFAIAKTDMANRTSCTVGGKDIKNTLHFLDFRVGRYSPSVSQREKEQGEIGWIDLMFEVDTRWKPEVHFVEGGGIWKSVERMIYEEMRARDHFFQIEIVEAVKDKATRGTSLRKRHRAGATRWNTLAEGYEDARAEMLRFTGRTAARLDDQFDSAALLSEGFDRLGLVEEGDDAPDEEFQMRRADPRRSFGRSATTGY